MNLHLINTRVDQALAANRRAEHIITAMAALIFLLGLVVAGVGYAAANPYVSSGAILFQSALYFPIRRIGSLRRDNIILQTFPVMITALPAERAADEIVKLLDFLKKL